MGMVKMLLKDMHGKSSNQTWFKIIIVTWALNRYKQDMSYYALEKESRKLWKKMFFKLFELSTAYIVDTYMIVDKLLVHGWYPEMLLLIPSLQPQTFVLVYLRVHQK